MDQLVASQHVLFHLIPNYLCILNLLGLHLPLVNLPLPRQQPLLIKLDRLLDQFPFRLRRHIQQLQSVPDQIKLYLVVQRRIRCK